MEVIATAQGYYGEKIRNEGDRFTISGKDAFSEVWMDKVDTDSKAKSVKKDGPKKATPAEVHHAALEKATAVTHKESSADADVL